MLCALITDTHFGVRDDSLVFLDYMQLFYDGVFFPYLKEHGISHIIHLGDLVDKRKNLNIHTLNRMKDMFFRPLEENDISIDIIIGNHDCYFKNTNRVNSVEELNLPSVYKNKIRTFSSPTEVTVGNTKLLYVPWITLENEEETVQLIKTTKAKCVFGHLELAGFQMYRGIIAHEHGGLEKKLFDRFKLIASGHYHTISSDGSIQYLGAPYEMVWSDFNDARGFWVFDTETLEIEHIPNPYSIFHKIEYSEDLDIGEMDFSPYAHTYIKLVIHDKNNPDHFNLFRSKLEAVNPTSLSFIENFEKDVNLEETEEPTEFDNTFTVIEKYVMNTCKKEDQQKKLISLFSDLYNEAQKEEV